MIDPTRTEPLKIQRIRIDDGGTVDLTENADRVVPGNLIAALAADVAAYDMAAMVSGRGGPLRVDVSPAVAQVTAGEPSLLVVEVTNTDPVIREVHIGVLGLDPAWVRVEPPTRSLFPDERASVVVIVTLPDTFPAGRRQAAIEVTDTSDPLPPAVVDVLLEVPAKPRVRVTLEPGSITTGRSATLSATVVNCGNAVLDVDLVGSDPESALTTVLHPPQLTLQPGQEAVVAVAVKGKRPLIGAAAVRAYTLTANAMVRRDAIGLAPSTFTAGTVDLTGTDPGIDLTDPSDADSQPTEASVLVAETATAVVEPDATDLAIVSIVQKPWLARRLISLAGLLGAVTVLALVFTKSFSSVADAARSSQDMVKKSLSGADGGTRVAPSVMAGTVLASTGSPLDGIAVEVYDVAKGPLLPVMASVTDEKGTFSLSGLPKGTYRLRVTGAGFGERWYPKGATFDQGQDLAIDTGKSLDGLSFQIVGLPASVSGAVLGDGVDGAIVTVRVPADSLPAAGSDPVPAVLQTATVDKTGLFVLGDLPTPGTYEVVASTPTLSSGARTIHLEPGQSLRGISLLLQPGDGIIRGSIVDASGAPIAGAEVVASDGAFRLTTLSLSSNSVGSNPTQGASTPIASTGSFELRDLKTPGTYSITVSRAGYFSTTQSVHLDAQQSTSGITISLAPSTGRIGGHVVDGQGQPLGGVTVAVSGAGGTRLTATLSQGDVGAWQMTGLMIPGDYTVTFSGSAMAPQSLAVSLTLAAGARDDVDASVGSAVASVHGVIRELGAATDAPGCNPDDVLLTDCPGRLSGVKVTLSSSTFNRTTISADTPTGAYRFDHIPPGAYTIVFTRVGSTPQTLFVNLGAGDDTALNDVLLEPQARISGQVTSGGVPMANVGVRVYRLSQYPNTPTVTAVADNLGRYTIVGLDAPETYVVEFQVPAGGPVAGSQQVFLRPGETGLADFAF